MGHISFVGKLDGDTLRAGAPAIAPGFTLDLMARHSLDFWLTSEDLPDPDNRVTLDREGNIVLAYRPNNEEGHRRLTAELKRLMNAQTKCTLHGHERHQGLFAPHPYLGQRIPPPRPAHPHGLLAGAQAPAVGPTLLVAKVEEHAAYAGHATAVGTNRWAGGAVDPHGYREIEHWRHGGTTPVWTYAVADPLVEKRVWIEPGGNTTYVRYHVVRA